MNAMTTLDLAARENADAASRLLDQFLRAVEGRGNVRAVVKFALLTWSMVRDVWEQFQLGLDQGLEAGRARTAAASAALACESLLRTVARLEAALTKEAAEKLDGLPELTAAVPEVEAIRKAARALVNTLDAPAPVIDEARLAEGLAAVGRGESEDTTAIIERLRAGGEL
jgi:hypothetical protein